MSWKSLQTYSLQLLVNQVAGKLGIKPADLLEEEKVGIIDGINLGITTAWDQYPWPEILETYEGNVIESADGDYTSILDNSNAEMLTIEGVYSKHPGSNPTSSPITYNQYGDRLYLLDSGLPSTVFIQYWPVPPVYETSDITSTISEPISTASPSDRNVVPYVLHRFLLHKSYADMLLGDGQHDKASLIAAEAERILYQEQSKADNKRQGYNR
tara:strand:- start:5958 stop:6596 length:639 start_codon:yes stop_codon:yes gene_type:complete